MLCMKKRLVLSEIIRHATAGESARVYICVDICKVLIISSYNVCVCGLIYLYLQCQKDKRTGRFPVLLINYIMNTSVLFSLVSAIAANNPNGFTFNVETLSAQTGGFAVACADTQNSFGSEGLTKVIDYVAANADRVKCIGGWLDVESGLYYYDATIVVDDLSEALALAKINNQIAIFDLSTFTEIRL